MWITRFGSRESACRADLYRKMAGAASSWRQSVPAIPATDPPQGTAEFISHIWDISGKVHARNSRKYHTERGEGNKINGTTEGISKAKEQEKFLHDRESIPLQPLEVNIVEQAVRCSLWRRKLFTYHNGEGCEHAAGWEIGYSSSKTTRILHYCILPALY